jgi:hypothetical protein
MTDIVNIPDLLPISQYPALGSANFNQEAYNYATSVPPAVSRMREVAVACRTCAIAAREQADAAMGYRTQAANSAAAAEAAKAISQAAASSAETFKNQAQSAAASAAASAQAVDQYMLGPKTVPPTTDNQGGAIKLGAMYINVGTDPNLNNRWFWWGGNVLRWVPGVGDLPAAFMPRGGGIFTGHIEVPQGASGNQAPRASEVIAKAPEVWGKTKLMGELQVGFALLTTESGRGGDWPADVGNSQFQAWLVETTGAFGRAKQIATQIFFSDTQRLQGSTFRRVLHDNAWSAWDRVLSAGLLIERNLISFVPTTQSTYVVDPAVATVHHVVQQAALTYQLPNPRGEGDQVTLRAQSTNGVQPITLPTNCRYAGPMPTYGANQIVTIVFIYSRNNNVWDAFFSGVHTL